MTQELKPGEVDQNTLHLANLLRREGHYSGVWFGEQLIKAGGLIERQARQLAERELELAEATAAMKRIAYADCTLARAEETARAFLASKEQNGG